MVQIAVGAKLRGQRGLRVAALALRTPDLLPEALGKSQRLLDDPSDDFSAFIDRVHHVQARVGYDQGPQVPHPAAPEYQPALAFAERFWQQVWHSQRQRGYPQTTLTPEFGADGYLHHLPFTNVPVADLWSLNAWMAARQQAHFQQFLSLTEQEPQP